MTYITVINLIVAPVVLTLIYVYALAKIIRKEKAVARRSTVGLIITTFYIVSMLIIFTVPQLDAKDMLQLLLTVGLVTATVSYAISAHKQAEEMKEQGISNLRPIIVQEAVYEKDIFEGSTSNYFSHFKILNVGNTPAVEVEISLVDTNGHHRHSIRQTYLKSEAPPIEFRPYELASLDESVTFYVVSEYQSVYSRGNRERLYQTRLPFKVSKASKEDKIYVVAGELEFSEVAEGDDIDAFSRRSKPK